MVWYILEIYSKCEHIWSSSTYVMSTSFAKISSTHFFKHFLEAFLHLTYIRVFGLAKFYWKRMLWYRVDTHSKCEHTWIFSICIMSMSFAKVISTQYFHHCLEVFLHLTYIRVFGLVKFYWEQMLWYRLDTYSICEHSWIFSIYIMSMSFAKVIATQHLRQLDEVFLHSNPRQTTVHTQ